MNIRFEDIYKESTYENLRVAFILGKHTIFNNIVSDKIKKNCLGDTSFKSVSIRNLIFDASDLDDNNNEDDTEDGITNTPFDKFMDYVITPALVSKWYCKVSLGELNKNQMTKLMSYIRKPNVNGVLVIESLDWLEYKDLLKSKLIGGSMTVHMFQLSFPPKDILKQIVDSEFRKYNCRVQEDARTYFIKAMKDCYDDYESTINLIANEHIKSERGNKAIILKDMKNLMRGREHYSPDDLIEFMIKEPTVKQKNNKKARDIKQTRVLYSLIEQMSARKLLNECSRRIDERIRYREILNTGIVPSGVDFIYKDTEDYMKQKAKYLMDARDTETKFKRGIREASKAPLWEWIEIKNILNSGMVSDSSEIMELKATEALYKATLRHWINTEEFGIADKVKKFGTEQEI